MPTYEYKCTQCQVKTSVIRSINETDPGYECSTCKIPLTKVYSVGNPVFKGSGFYSKDK